MARSFLLTLLTMLICTQAIADVRFWKLAWPDTDFTKSSVDFNTILDGGPGKDGIPAISNPKMTAVLNQDTLDPREPVMVVAVSGQVPRAYPVRYLMWHEIVNDQVGDVPFAVTFCPLCNSGVTFDRRLNGQVLTLGVSGLLRKSDMIMYDKTTNSWWQQFTGEAIVGDFLGAKLTKLPSWMESWGAFAARHPDGLVQSEPQTQRQYGANPYQGYDSGTPFLYRGENPPHKINPLERVVVVGTTAWPLSRFKTTDTIKEAGVILSWTKGTASALDTGTIAQGRDVGAIRVKNTAGEDIVHDVSFAFAFHAFHPNGTWMIGR